MKKNNLIKKNLIFVVYDGIENTVFSGQVLEPLLKKQSEYSKIIIISFEPKKLSSTKINTLTKHLSIEFHECKRIPFIGKLSLHYASHQLKKILSSQNKNYDLIARGPFASWISKKSINSRCKKLTLQARGIAAKEYEYIHQNKTSFIKKIAHSFRKFQLSRIEKKAYREHTDIQTEIEAVCPALKDFIIKEYRLSKDKITIAKDDIPQKIKPKKIQELRQKHREKLDYKDNNTVYCYNGSCHAWQCPEKTIQFFEKKYLKNKTRRLLIITLDVKEFEKLLAKSKLPTTSYKILSIAHKNVHQYLSACDFGIIFRKKHIINWTSRPTKALEYQSVNLSIIHNNTVAYLSK